jgi:4'-phosphopantetheinyl transferase
MVIALEQNQTLKHPDGVLPQNEVHVWHLGLKLPPEGAGALERLLNPEERDRLNRFKVAAPRDQFLISRVFLRQALGLYLKVDPREVQFNAGVNGKPELADARLHFNLSHTEGMVVLAIARDWRVGIDVERVRAVPDAIKLADRFFSVPEAECVKSQPAAHLAGAFFDCWTAKEAYIKACGKGLSMPLHNFRIVAAPGSTRLELEVFGDMEESKRWSMWRLDLGPELRAALAVEGTGSVVRVGQWPGLGH